jgi:hypothetical protein
VARWVDVQDVDDWTFPREVDTRVMRPWLMVAG